MVFFDLSKRQKKVTRPQDDKPPRNFIRSATVLLVWLRLAARCHTILRRHFIVDGATATLVFFTKRSPALRKNRCQFLRWNDFELGISTAGWLFVRAPPAELRDVAEAASLHVVVSDFRHQFGAHRFPR